MRQLVSHPGWTVLERIAGEMLASKCRVRDPGEYDDFATQRAFYDGMLEMRQFYLNTIEDSVSYLENAELRERGRVAAQEDETFAGER